MLRQHNTSEFDHLAHVDFSQDLPRKKVVRGVLSNGSEWLFIILRLNKNGKGGGYMASRHIMTGPGVRYHIKSDIIAGILAHWVCHRVPLSVGDVHEHVTGTTLS